MSNTAVTVRANPPWPKERQLAPSVKVARIVGIAYSTSSNDHIAIARCAVANGATMVCIENG